MTPKTGVARKRNTRLGVIANKLGRLNYFPKDINEAAEDNNMSDFYEHGFEVFQAYMDAFSRSRNLVHPIKF